LSADTESRKGGQEEERRCSGRTKEGEACGVEPELLTVDGEGRWWCWSHNPHVTAAEKAAGRERGGMSTARRNRKRKGLHPREVGRLESLEDCERISALIATATATGELSATQARATLAALKEFRAAVADGKILSRVKELEAALKKNKRR
jgi:hypothetical protein